MNTAKRAWAFMFHITDSAKTADGWRRALIHILALWLAAWAFRLAMGAVERTFPFIAERGIFEIARDWIWILLLASAVFSPAIYGFTFRLRAARGLAGKIVAVVMYAPIFGLGLIVAFSSIVVDEGAGRVWDNLLSGNWVGVMLIAGLIGSALYWPLHLAAGKAPGPPPAIMSSRFYAPIEMAVCVSALAFILIVFSMADW